MRAGVRARRYELFLEAQPGVLHWSRSVGTESFTPPNTFNVTYAPVDRFVSAVGAGIEVSPADRVHIRAFVSDLVEKQNAAWKNNFQPNIGVYFGVGKMRDWQPPLYQSEKVHRFFDAKYFALLVGDQLADTADSVTTFQFMHHGIREGNPVDRPLVNYGLPGLISLQVIEVGLLTVSMYGLHRVGHHGIERSVPFCVGADHAVAAYNNTKLYSR